jgi:GT2 family glycosyltransferase
VIRVVEIDLDRPRPVSAIDGLDDGNSLFAIVRWRGTPVGYLTLPARRGQHRPLGDIATQILAHHEGAIFHLLLASALSTHGIDLSRAVPSFDQPDESPNRPAPSLTVAVCTRDRSDDLARCVGAIDRLTPAPLEVVVIENAPRTSDTERWLRTNHPRVRHMVEPCPGLNWARRRAVQDARGDIVAFVDDDVEVDAGWAGTIARTFADHDDVMAVTGLVAPAELITDAQIVFEQGGGLGKGFTRRWLRRRRDEMAAPRFANAGPFGIGANMAFRRSVFADVGSFDPALGAGTITGGGDDLDLFFRVLEAGHTLVYEPAALVRHRHRREMPALVHQLEQWSRGMQAYLARSMRAYPDERVALAALSARLRYLYYPRRVVQSLAAPGRALPLALAELRGAWAGRGCYDVSARRARELAAEFAMAVDDRDRAVPRPGREPRGHLRPLRTVAIDIAHPLPATLPGPDDSDVVHVEVAHHTRALGAVTVVAGGYPVARTRLADAIVSTLGGEILRLAPAWRQAVQAAVRG